ncbi:hypothetical protein EVA_07785 [gut metagenome]|uniref:Uncharacterized protein n=1 Tax=gut metagenome TaxID=749906 RepID=J9GP30_9ZZZZ
MLAVSNLRCSRVSSCCSDCPIWLNRTRFTVPSTTKNTVQASRTSQPTQLDKISTR